MNRPLRCDLFSPDEVSICHVVQFCVRRMNLIGVDERTGEDVSYRREWIRQRLEKLASIFAVDILSYAVLYNHFHVVLRNRPDVLKIWSDKEVAMRWLQIFPGKRFEEQPESPTTADVEALANDQDKMATVRSRLSDFSWFMKALSETIARRANAEENRTGPFWEAGFKAQRLLDDVGLLACCMNVELNPIRNALAQSTNDSTYTSAFDRWKASQGKTIESSAALLQPLSQREVAAIRKKMTSRKTSNVPKNAAKREGPKILRDAWLAPLTIGPRQQGPVANKTGCRASDKGFLHMSFEAYFELFDFTSRRGRPDNRSKVKPSIESQLSPLTHAILNKLGIADGMWCELVWNYNKYFGRSSSVGSPDRMSEDALSNSRSFHPGQNSARHCFTK